MASKKATGIFNISGADYMSVFDLVYMVADFWKLDKSLLNMATSEGLKQPAKRPPITGFNINKAKQMLGYKPKTFKEGLAIINQQLNLAQ
jgi:dTDP-4-dehydrorhamnose reductase